MSYTHTPIFKDPAFFRFDTGQFLARGRLIDRDSPAVVVGVPLFGYRIVAAVVVVLDVVATSAVVVAAAAATDTEARATTTEG